MMLILSPLFSNMVCRADTQTLYRNQAGNIQCVYRILTYKDSLMLWQISIMGFGKQDFLDWIIFAINAL
ncbi:hypothetical protein [Bacteroides sp. An19]|uniref:hypothetical protein n=1 Tax=Bacteroides sp. An19 TaxID=1965580 RepID=UPI000B389870|nr:hypothetical protein [Bacteroides sp. An19]OUP32298.1 hypothetical protein B5F25_09250 [Bacteroides sp. An19]